MSTSMNLMIVTSGVIMPGDGLVDETTTENLLDSVRTFVGPIFLLIVAAVSLTFIFKRQTTQLFQFLAIAIAVAVLFYATDIIPAIAQYLSSWITG